MDQEITLSALMAELKALNDKVSQPLVLHGRNYLFVDRKEAARHLSVSEDTFDRWVAKGYMPQPIDPEPRAGKGNKIRRWDLYEVIEWFTSYRKN